MNEKLHSDDPETGGIAASEPRIPLSITDRETRNNLARQIMVSIAGDYEWDLFEREKLVQVARRVADTSFALADAWMAIAAERGQVGQ